MERNVYMMKSQNTGVYSLLRAGACKIGELGLQSVDNGCDKANVTNHLNFVSVRRKHESVSVCGLLHVCEREKVGESVIY